MYDKDGSCDFQYLVRSSNNNIMINVSYIVMIDYLAALD